MPLNKIYQKTGDTPIQTFSFTDLATGQGYVRYFAATGTDENILTTNVVLSNEIQTVVSFASLSSTPALAIDLDFDIEFKVPQTIEGKAIVNVTIGTESESGGTSTNTFIIAKIRKVSGGVETDLAENQSDTLQASDAAIETKVMLIEIEVPKTAFKIGDILRLTIEQWHFGLAGGTSNGDTGFAHDPKARVSDTEAPLGKVIQDGFPTTLTCDVPFRVER